MANIVIIHGAKKMPNQAFLATLTWLEDSLNSVIAHCKDKDIKLSLSRAKKEISLSLSKVLEEN
jgi:hypothetical protein